MLFKQHILCVVLWALAEYPPACFKHNSFVALGFKSRVLSTLFGLVLYITFVYHETKLMFQTEWFYHLAFYQGHINLHLQYIFSILSVTVNQLWQCCCCGKLRTLWMSIVHGQSRLQKELDRKCA